MGEGTFSQGSVSPDWGERADAGALGAGKARPGAEASLWARLLSAIRTAPLAEDGGWEQLPFRHTSPVGEKQRHVRNLRITMCHTPY